MASIIDSTLDSVKSALDPLLEGGAAGTDCAFVELWPNDPERAVEIVEKGGRGLFVQFGGLTNTYTDATRAVVDPLITVLIHYVDATEWGIERRASGFGTYLAGAYKMCDEIMDRLAGQRLTVTGCIGTKSLGCRFVSFGEGRIEDALSTWTAQVEVGLPVKS